MAQTRCTNNLQLYHGNAFTVVSLVGKQPHENNTVLVGLNVSDTRPEYKGQQLMAGWLYNRDGSLVTVYFNSKIPGWKAP